MNHGLVCGLGSYPFLQVLHSPLSFNFSVTNYTNKHYFFLKEDFDLSLPPTVINKLLDTIKFIQLFLHMKRDKFNKLNGFSLVILLSINNVIYVKISRDQIGRASCRERV